MATCQFLKKLYYTLSFGLFHVSGNVDNELRNLKKTVLPNLHVSTIRQLQINKIPIRGNHKGLPLRTLNDRRGNPLWLPLYGCTIRVYYFLGVTLPFLILTAGFKNELGHNQLSMTYNEV